MGKESEMPGLRIRPWEGEGRTFRCRCGGEFHHRNVHRTKSQHPYPIYSLCSLYSLYFLYSFCSLYSLCFLYFLGAFVGPHRGRRHCIGVVRFQNGKVPFVVSVIAPRVHFRHPCGRRPWTLDAFGRHRKGSGVSWDIPGRRG